MPEPEQGAVSSYNTRQLVVPCVGRPPLLIPRPALLCFSGGIVCRYVHSYLLEQQREEITLNSPLMLKTIETLLQTLFHLRLVQENGRAAVPWTQLRYFRATHLALRPPRRPACLRRGSRNPRVATHSYGQARGWGLFGRLVLDFMAYGAQPNPPARVNHFAFNIEIQ